MIPGLADARDQIEFVEQVEAGEELMVCRRNLPVAKLVPLTAPAPPIRLADVRGWVGDDDNSFQESLERRRAEAMEMQRPDPFAS